MNSPWLAKCTLVAQDQSHRFWQVESDRVEVRLLVRAKNAIDFQNKVAKSLEGTGVDLTIVSEPENTSNKYLNRSPSVEMRQALQTVDDVTPLLISKPLAKPLTDTFSYAEVAWSDIPAARNLWALIDGVTWEGLSQLIAGSDHDAVCLYTSTDPQSLAAAPWLVRLDSADGFMKALMQRKPEQHTGIVFQSPLGLQGLRRHFRRFTMLATPIGGEVPQYFRFYDPRVMLDGLTALDPSVRDQLLRPLRGLFVPLSPDCLVPTDAKLDSPPDVFDDPLEYVGRTLQVTWNFKELMEIRPSPMAIDEPSFQRFGVLKTRRSLNDLAKYLFDNIATVEDNDACIQAAERAPAVAAKFGLSSKKQVVAIARALLRHGPQFWVDHPKVNAILTDTHRLPWQRKNDLVAWLDVAQTRAPKRAAS